MVKIFFPSSYELKTNQFSGEDLFFSFCLGIHLYLDRKPTTLTAMTFFLVFAYFWTEKHHETPSWVPPFLATPLQLIEAIAAYLFKFNEALSYEWLIYFLTSLLRHFFFTQICKLNNYEYLAALIQYLSVFRFRSELF